METKTFFVGTYRIIQWNVHNLIVIYLPISKNCKNHFYFNFQIPETPQWLLSKNRMADEEKSLRWLRGWVSSEAVAQEFHYLQRHSERSKSCNTCIKKDLKCTHPFFHWRISHCHWVSIKFHFLFFFFLYLTIGTHPLPTMREKFAELKRKRTIKPFGIVITLFFLAQFSGILSMRPFMLQIFKAYESPIPPDQAAAIMSLLDNLANVTFMLLVRFTGKRRLYLFCLSGVLVCAGTISWYGFTYLPANYISFDQAHHEVFHLENKNLGYIPMICLLMWSYFAFCGFNGCPWILLSELFPFK